MLTIASTPLQKRAEPQRVPPELLVRSAGHDGAVNSRREEASFGDRQLVEKHNVKNLTGGSAISQTIAVGWHDVGNRHVRTKNPLIIVARTIETVARIRNLGRAGGKARRSNALAIER